MFELNAERSQDRLACLKLDELRVKEGKVPDWRQRRAEATRPRRRYQVYNFQSLLVFKLVSDGTCLRIAVLNHYIRPLLWCRPGVPQKIFVLAA